MKHGKIDTMKGTWRAISGPDSDEDFLIRTDIPNPGDHIHVTDHHAPITHGMRGYGGRTLAFPLDGGGVYVAVGPWHSNATALKAATGLDLTETHRTRVLIKTEDGEALYVEDRHALGKFDRGRRTASNLATARGEKLRVRVESEGGSSEQTVSPDA